MLGADLVKAVHVVVEQVPPASHDGARGGKPANHERLGESKPIPTYVWRQLHAAQHVRPPQGMHTDLVCVC